MDDENESRRGFRVTDRRRFSESGERREEAPEREESSPPVTEPGSEGQERPDPAATEPVTFASFVLGLSTQALLHLGEIPDPASGAVHRDIAAARQVIDILGIIREKTRNNLEQGEESLLESVLYDLRMRFVELLQPGTKGE